MFDSYEAGTRCWVRSPQLGWEGATVVDKKVENNACEVHLKLDQADTTELKKVTIKSDPAPELPLRNPPVLEATSDLVTLSYLNEPSVLHAIHQRYQQLDIYTFSGIVLIATNPFDRVDNLYTDEVVQMYSGRQRGELDPHLFSIAEDAFRCMQRDDRNQTIVVSGESGAGKTMSAKYIMRYFATVENPNKPTSNNSSQDGLSTVEREILATNPIMEAFGNAKTVRNDNSSRFGKYLEIRFQKDLSISGAQIRTYLLERSRIVSHQKSERGYHIFYQLVKGLPTKDLEKLGLQDGVSGFQYINQGDESISGVDDKEEFKQTCSALQTVGVSGESQWQVFEILASLLHLGNIQITQTSRAPLVSSEDKHLKFACDLLKLDPTQLAKWLVKKQLKMRQESIVSDLTYQASLMVRDSIAKFIYSALFDWLVSAVNSKLFTGDTADKFIGVLDIYGFEHFKHNSFEQFCINYANEKLQQEFNRHVFKLEQQEYKEEEIDWQYVDFVDNQPCIALIEDRTGILGLLDEESRLPSGTDDGFTQKLFNNLKERESFKVPRLGESSFIVAHYAHDVEYETSGFLEKNRDTVPDTVMEVLNASQNEFLKEILDLQAKNADEQQQQQQPQISEKAKALGPPKLGGPGGPGGGGPAKRMTLGRMFKMSLIELMDTISSTNAHYIRCIKPNEEKAAWKFDGPMVLSQLRACGVLETIRISSKGFPGRWMYEEFAARYALLLNSTKQGKTKDPRELTVKILEDISPELTSETSEGGSKDLNEKGRIYALGKSKVFLRAGMLAKLENLRTKRSKSAAVTIQRFIKMRYARAKYDAIRKFVLTLQTQSRGKLERLRYEQVVLTTSITALQSIVRAKHNRTNFLNAQRSLTAIQTRIRSQLAQKHALQTQKEQAAVSIQSLVRSFKARQAYERQRRSLITVQSMVRRRGARQQLKQLKEDQNSVKHFEEKQYRMENKVVELQNALATKREDHRLAAKRVEELELELNSSQSEARALSTNLGEEKKLLEQRCHDLEAELATQRQSTQKLQTEFENLKKLHTEAQQALTAKEQELESLQSELLETKSKNERLQEQLEFLVPPSNRSIANHNVGYRSLHDGAAAAAGGAAGAAAIASPIQNRGSFNTNSNHHSAAFSNTNMRELEDRQESLNVKIEELLKNPKVIVKELTERLISSLEVPTAGLETISILDVLFPGNISNLLTSELWRCGNVAASEMAVSNVLKAIQELTSKTVGKDAIYVLPFWLSNTMEIYSFFCLAFENIQNDSEFGTQMSSEELEQYAKLMSVAREDSFTVLSGIYYLYIREMKKLVNKMTVSAIVEDQNIPGFVAPNQTNILSSLFPGSKHTMDDLILLLTKISTALRGFRVEFEIIQSVMEELLTLIGYASFNDLIMRRNFLTWRRGVQIAYNATRITEWAKGHQCENLLDPLMPLMQSAKLLQLRINFNDKDASVIYDICYALNSSQILKLITNYVVQDFEAPMSQDIQKAISADVQKKGEKEAILIKLPPVTDVKEFPQTVMARHLEKLEPYIPITIEVPHLREFVDTTTSLSRVTEQAQQLEDMVSRVEAEEHLAHNSSIDGSHHNVEQQPDGESTRVEL